MLGLTALAYGQFAAVPALTSSRLSVLAARSAASAHRGVVWLRISTDGNRVVSVLEAASRCWRKAGGLHFGS